MVLVSLVSIETASLVLIGAEGLDRSTFFDWLFVGVASLALVVVGFVGRVPGGQRAAGCRRTRSPSSARSRGSRCCSPPDLRRGCCTGRWPNRSCTTRPIRFSQHAGIAPGTEPAIAERTARHDLSLGAARLGAVRPGRTHDRESTATDTVVPLTIRSASLPAARCPLDRPLAGSNGGPAGTARNRLRCGNLDRVRCGRVERHAVRAAAWTGGESLVNQMRHRVSGLRAGRGRRLVSGLARGIRRLSEVNVWVSAALLLAILALGPTLVLLNQFVRSAEPTTW